MTSTKKTLVALLVAVSATLASATGLAGAAESAPTAIAKPDCAIGGLLGGGGGC